MNTLIISIGSNEESEKNIALCRNQLLALFDSIFFSSTSCTKPFGKQYKNDFLNQLAFVNTEEELDTIKKGLKALEKKMGRNAEDKEKGIVKIDIDIVKWNDTVLREKDWQRDYVIELLPSLQDAVNYQIRINNSDYLLP